MAGSLASINILFRVDLAQLSSGLQNATRELAKQGEAFQAAGRTMSTYFTLPILAAGGAALKLASDFNESNNKVEVAFKDSANVVQEFAKTTLTSFGIAEGSALDMAALFGDMATSMGLPESEAAKLSTSMVGLAGDLASFKNIGLDIATTALNGVFTGETESLKKLGIIMTEVNLIQYALSKGITKNYRDFTQAEKVQLRYAYVMQQTTNAQGDFTRTGGAAANQTRVLQESLKEIGAQFGQVILPAFTAFVSKINNALAGLKNMDSGTRNSIVFFAGLAAAIGPVLFGIGAIAKAGVIAADGIAVLGRAFALAANLIGTSLIYLGESLAAIQVYAIPIAIALGAVYLAYKLLSKEAVALTAAQRAQIEQQKVLTGLNETAAKSISGQAAMVKQLYAAGRNLKLGYEDRVKAIAQLNKISPEYFGNLTTETINTKAAADAVENYNKSLLKGALAKAAQEKITEIFKEQVDRQFKLIDSKDKQVAIDEKLLKNTQGQAAALKAAAEQQDAFKKLSEITQKSDEIKDKKKIEFLNQIFTDNKKYLALLEGIGIQTDINNEAGTKSGTINFYNEQIKVLEKYRLGTAVTTAEVIKTDEKIAALREAISKLEGKRVTITAVLDTVKSPELKSQGTIEAYDAEISKLQELQSQVVTTSDLYKELDLAIAKKELEKAVKFDIEVDSTGLDTANESLNYFGKNLKNKGKEFHESLKEPEKAFKDFQNQIRESFKSAASNVLEGFGEVLGNIASGANGIEAIYGMLGNTLGGLLIELGKIAIQTALGITAIQTALKSFNPVVAAAAGIALIAFGTIIKNKVKDAGAFADGGIVGGSSFTGDRLFARVNSGEMILNDRQQRNLYNMITPAATAEGMMVQFMGNFEVTGDSLRLVLDRNDKKRNRTS